MKTVIRILLGIALATTGVVGTGQAAIAHPSQDPLANYLAGLTPSQRQAFVAANIPSRTVETRSPQIAVDSTAQDSLSAAGASGQSVTAAAAGCWTRKVTYKAYAAAGNALYSWYHVGKWCSNGSKVTSASIADKGAQLFAPLWRYQGVSASGAGIVSLLGVSYTQHRFVLGSGGVDVQTRLECARVKGSAGAGSAVDRVCGIY